MANKKIWLGMLVIVLVFGMTIIGCGAGGLDGTWENVGSPEWILIFSGKNFTDITPYQECQGTYSIKGDKIEFSYISPGSKTEKVPFSRIDKNTIEIGDATQFTRKQESKSKSSGGSKALVGRWALEPGQPTHGNVEDMELLKDGTGIVDGQGISWKVENDCFYVTHSLKAAAWGYKISGSTLTLTTDDGKNLTYKKK